MAARPVSAASVCAVGPPEHAPQTATQSPRSRISKFSSPSIALPARGEPWTHDPTTLSKVKSPLMNEQPLKLCIDCKHLRLGLQCARNGFVKFQDPVTGKWHVMWRMLDAEHEREEITFVAGAEVDHCGIEGRHFSALPKLDGSWARILRLWRTTVFERAKNTGPR